MCRPYEDFAIEIICNCEKCKKLLEKETIVQDELCNSCRLKIYFREAQDLFPQEKYAGDMIIACYWRFMANEYDWNKTDADIITEHGGDYSNEIVCATDRYYIYRSTSCHDLTFYTVIDRKNLELAETGEGIET